MSVTAPVHGPGPPSGTQGIDLRDRNPERLFDRSFVTGIGGRLAALFLAVVLLVSIPVGLWVYYSAHELAERHARNALQSLLEHDQGLLRTSITRRDHWELFRFTRSLAQPDYVYSAVVLDEEGRLLAHSDPARYAQPDRPFVLPSDARAERIAIQGLAGPAGELILVWNEAALRNAFTPARSALVMVVGFFSLLAVGLGLMIALLWRRRLRRILAHTGDTATSFGMRPVESRTSARGDELDALEERLVGALDQLRLSQWLLDSVREYVLLVDEQGRICHANGTTSQLCRCDRRCVGRNITQMVSTEARGELREALANGRTGTLETEVHTCGGHFPALLSYRHTGDQGVISVTDLTEYRRLKNRVEKLRALSVLGKMSTELTHELKNDIAPAKLLCQTAGMEEADREVMLRSLDRVDELVEDFMAFVRGEQQPVRAIRMHAAFKEWSAGLRNQARNRDVSLELDVEDVEVRVSPGSLRMVFTNLVRNAIQAVPDGGRVWVEVRLEADGGLYLSVRDDGPGIPDRVRDQLYEPFVTTREEGTGLGLALVYRHVTQAGGAIAHESLPEGGTRFTVRCPVHAAVSERPLIY